MPPPILQLRAVAKSYAGVQALRGVDFDLRAGEVHALVGENGAGKSSLVKIVTGAHAPDEGEIVVGEERWNRLDPGSARRLGIAAIYQQPALFPDLSVAENIALRLAPPRAWRRIDWKASRTRAKQLLDRIGATVPPEAEVCELSFSEQQLVEIACALGAAARIVIMDEPTASLTQNDALMLFAAIRTMRSSGAGVIYISHKLDEVFTLADRITVLRDGERVGTLGGGEFNQTEVIRLMVGREMRFMYPVKAKRPGVSAVKLQKVGCSVSGVQGVDLEIHAGEVFGLYGLVGSGRTELARTLFGLTPADSGAVLIGDRRVTLTSPMAAMGASIAYVPEDRRRQGVVLEMSVAENITMAVPARISRRGWLKPRTERTLAAEYLRRLSIRTRSSGERVAQLSGGNQQKVALARGLATNPAVLILDEPTQGVDVGAKAEIHGLVRHLAEQGMAVLFISSDLPEILGMSDRIGVMRQGTLAGIFPADAAATAIAAAAIGLNPGHHS